MKILTGFCVAAIKPFLWGDGVELICGNNHP